MVAHSELYEKVKVILSNMHITKIICINPTFSSSNTHTWYNESKPYEFFVQHNFSTKQSKSMSFLSEIIQTHIKIHIIMVHACHKHEFYMKIWWFEGENREKKRRQNIPKA